MIPKNQVKQVTALHQKKFRREYKAFIVEGKKLITDLFESQMNVISLFGTQDFFQKLPSGIRIPKNTEIILASEIELSKMSTLSSPQSVLAVVSMPEDGDEINFESGTKLVLDGISDPGNLGTLIRIADWFGFDEIICSDDSAECYNPKVVQASMGSLFRKKIYYSNLSDVFSKNQSLKNLPVYGTTLNGKNIYEEKFKSDSFIIGGNESTGIRSEILKFITHPVTIPGSSTSAAESLNVAVAIGIVCAEFRRGDPK